MGKIGNMNGIKSKKIFFEDWVIKECLKEKNVRSTTKAVELLVGIVLLKFCERQWNSKCWIGLEVKDKCQRDIPEKGVATPEELWEIIHNKIEEATDIDITIAKIPNHGSDVSKGMQFQIKRFKNIKEQDTDSLIQYLNCDCRKKYPKKTQASLVILMETSKTIDLKRMKKFINTENYPFEKIILISVFQKRFIDFYVIWPEAIWSRFDALLYNFEF